MELNEIKTVEDSGLIYHSTSQTVINVTKLGQETAQN
jgi:hypothetical protein